MNRNIPLVFSILLFAGILIPAYAQTTESVVINEIDINPPGDDSKSISEWVELYNPTDSDIDLSNWKIASTTILKKTMTISPGTVIEPGQFLTYSYQSVWFTDIEESVELRNENNIVVDKTPTIKDLQNDFTSWQRLYDGFDFDNDDDWKFVTSTAGQSNGKLIETQVDDQLVVAVSSEKPFYIFGEAASLSGSVSEEVFILKPFFQPQQIVMTITGPNFVKTLTMYPDLNLNFDATLSLHQVLGINEGTYDVSVTYAGQTANTEFSVGYEIIEEKIIEDAELGIITDKSQYIPGDLISITGFASEIIPFAGMKFTVTDAGGKLVASGNLFPTNGEFVTSIFITTVDPAFGTYNIIAEYFDKSATSSFEVLEDVKEDVPISLWTDKLAYGLGDKVEISGRLNQVWVSTLDLEIIQTTQSGLGVSNNESSTGFKILDCVRIEGDGFFTYSFTIPDNEGRLGDYRISVSKDIGSASTIIHAVVDPDSFVASEEPLTLITDKDVYEIGDKITYSGFIQDPFANSSYETGGAVKISISDEKGIPLEIIGLPKEIHGGSRDAGGITVGYSFVAIPETSGSYSVSSDIPPLIFTSGNYIVKAQYHDHTITKTFTVVDPLELTDGATISLDKEVYGLGETVFLTGIVPPIGVPGVEISLTRPDGSTSHSGSVIDNQRFEWSWVTPISEKFQSSKVDDTEKSVVASNFGVYKIRVSIDDSFNEEIFFKVSTDPENDSLSTIPLFVSTEKSLYKAGEKLKVIGTVIKRQQGNEGLVVPERVVIRVADGTFPFKQIHESTVYPDQGGVFSSIFELPATIFSEGPYTVKASYSNLFVNSEFSVTNDFTFGLDEDVTLLLATDASEYNPGDVVVITGKPNKLIYLEKFEVSVIKETDTEISCGSFVCGVHSGPVTSIRPSPSGSFTHQYVIPDSTSAIGKYEITVDADFEQKSILFDVVEKPVFTTSDTVIERENRIADKTISILTAEKTVDGENLSPRVVSGSLITPSRGEESSVNLKVTSISGVCIIGDAADCLVQESTRKPGQIYDVVEVDGVSLNVRYSGPDVRLEKFSILPESLSEFIPDTNWDIEVIKDEQVSRFYYKVTYKTIE